ncbi:uncharacterized protein LOC142225178 [Haematobia irritans]|uniref:uncharacterized protein LOC142225178 n=1 Tax=Haematobia irritans TaxID=7368 RepID=UPI003F508E9F
MTSNTLDNVTKYLAFTNFMIKYTAAKCEYNTTLIKTLKCCLRNTADNATVIDGNLQLAEIVSDFSIRTLLFLYRKNMPRFILADITVNLCDVLETVQKNKLVALFVKTFVRSLNEIPQCPFKKDFNYTLNGFSIDMNDFPSRLPEAEFKTVHSVSYERKLISQLTFRGQLIRKPKTKTG